MHDPNRLQSVHTPVLNRETLPVRAEKFGTDKGIHFISGRRAIAPVGFDRFAGFVLCAGRAKIDPPLQRTGTDFTLRAIRRNELQVRILAAQADKIDRICIPGAVIPVHLDKQ